jgi:hypothetical protein
VRRIYIAGPMRGYPNFNFPAFQAEAARWRSRGWEVITPVELEWLSPGLPTDQHRTHCLRDIAALAMCHAVVFLDGWKQSVGATAEHAAAVWMGLEIVYQAPGTQMAKDVLTTANREK